MKKIFLIIILIFTVLCAVLVAWWSLIFVPDDYDISRSEALLPSGEGVPEVIDYSMIENADSAVLSGYSASRINIIINDLVKRGFYIRNDSFARAKRKDMIFRFGTGYAGVWLDERSSIALPAGGSISYHINFKKDSRLEFSGLSPVAGGSLVVEITDGISYKKKSVELPAYKNPRGPADLGIKLNNRGYPMARDDLQWQECGIDLSGFAGRSGTVRFSFESGGGAAFVANPRVFRKAERKRYNVVYILMDGISNPYYDVYNSRSNLTPYLKKAADEDFAVFDNMITVGDKTRISVSGLFTSVMPFNTRHGINRNFIPREEKELFYKWVREGRLDSLPDVFRRSGYISTQIGNSGFTVDLLTTGVDYGFDRSYEFSVNAYNSYGLSRRLFEFLRQNRGREFFLYLHYNTPHKPFLAPISYYFKGLADSPPDAWWRPDFNACIRYSDDVFSHVYESLKFHGLLENTIVVYASDHGAGIFVTRFDAGTQYMEYLRIPFMMRVPAELKIRYHINNKRIESYISSINIAPTLAELAGLAKPPAFSGRSMIGVLNGTFSDDFFDREIWSFGRKQSSVITSDMFKYTFTSADAARLVNREYYSFGEEREVPFELLYDIKNDPFEKHNLILEKPDVLKKMRALYLERDFHHPERTVLAFFPGSKEKKNISVRAQCPSPFVSSVLCDKKIEVIKDALKKTGTGGKMIYSFELLDKPVYLVLQNENDRMPLELSILENGRMVDPGCIYTTFLNLNIAGNPAVFANKKDFLLLNATRLPAETDFYNDKNAGAISGSPLRVKIIRMDLHRWIDVGRLEAKGIGAGMKQTLKSWGYIQ